MPMLHPRRPGVIGSPLVLALLGTVLMLAGITVLPLLPFALAEEREYRSAPSCPDSVAALSQAGECRERTRAVVAGTEVTGRGDNQRYFVSFDVDGEQYRVRLASGQSDIDRFE